MTPPDGRGLLRWYPPEWRERYGPEMLAMIEDTLGGRRPGLRLRAELMAAGLAERLRRGGFIGRDRPAAERCRAGAVLVLAGWVTLVVAGAMFAKTTEHWRDRTTPTGRATADAAYTSLEVSALIGTVAVLAAVLAAMPALRRALAAGRWGAMRVPVRLAVAATGLATAATVALGFWAHQLDNAQRNGGSRLYDGAFLAWGVLFVATVGAWARAGIRVERQLRPGTRLLRFEWATAALTAAATMSVTVSIGLWWAAVAVDTPWVLHGTTAGSQPSWWSVNLGIVGIVSLLATASAAAGGARLVSAARAGLWRPAAGTPG